MSTINAQNFGDGTDSVPASAVLEGTAKVWCNFDGTAGTISGRKDYNVTSYTDLNTGSYEINITNNMADADYAGATGTRTDGGDTAFDASGNNTSSKVVIAANDTSGTGTDWQTVCAEVFGDLA